MKGCGGSKETCSGKDGSTALTFLGLFAHTRRPQAPAWNTTVPWGQEATFTGLPVSSGTTNRPPPPVLELLLSLQQSLLKTMGCHMRSRRRCCSAWQHIHSLEHWLHQRSACQPAELRRASEAFLFALPMTANMPLKHPQELHGFAGFRPQSIPGCQKAQGSIGNEWSPR